MRMQLRNKLNENEVETNGRTARLTNGKIEGTRKRFEKSRATESLSEPLMHTWLRPPVRKSDSRHTRIDASASVVIRPHSSQIFQGARPEFQRSSSIFFSRSVSMHDQNPRWV